MEDIRILFSERASGSARWANRLAILTNQKFPATPIFSFVVQAGCLRTPENQSAGREGTVDRLTIAAIAFLSIAGCISQPKPDPVAHRGASVTFEPALVDLGRIPWGTEHAVTTRLENHGPEPLSVAAIRATCECTGFDPAEYVGRTIAPGEAMPLVLRLRIGTRLGSHQSEIELMTARGTVYWFYIHYDAFATYTCVPEEVNFKDIALDDYDDSCELVQAVVFRSEAARIERIDSNTLWLESSWEDVRPREATVYVHVVREHLAHGEQVGALTIATDNPYHPEFPIRVTAYGRSALRAYPGHAFVRAGASARVMFIRPDGAKAEIVSAAPEDNGVRVEFVRGSNVVTVEADASAPPSVHRVRVKDEAGLSTRFIVSVVK